MQTNRPMKMSATDETADYKRDPNYAILCSFLNHFGKHLYENPSFLSIENLDSFLTTEEVSPEEGFLKLHLKLLKGIGNKTKSEKWEQGLIKFSKDFPEQDDKLIEEHGYAKIPVAAKLRIFKNLCEDQFHFNDKFNVQVNQSLAEEQEIRHLPVGTDKKGRTYWFTMDDVGSMRLFRSKVDNSVYEETWKLLCSEPDELKDLIASLESYDEKDRETTEDPVLEATVTAPADKLSFTTDMLKVTEDEIEDILEETKNPFPIYYKIPKTRNADQINRDETKHNLKHCFAKLSHSDRDEAEKWKEKEKIETELRKKMELKISESDDKSAKDCDKMECKSDNDNATTTSESHHLPKTSASPSADNKSPEILPQSSVDSNSSCGKVEDKTGESTPTASGSISQPISESIENKLDNVKSGSLEEQDGARKVDVKKMGNGEGVHAAVDRPDYDTGLSGKDKKNTEEKMDIDTAESNEKSDSKEEMENDNSESNEKSDSKEKMEIENSESNKKSDTAVCTMRKHCQEKKSSEDDISDSIADKSTDTITNGKEVTKQKTNSNSETSAGKSGQRSCELDLNKDSKLHGMSKGQFEDDLDMKETLMRISELSGSSPGPKSTTEMETEDKMDHKTKQNIHTDNSLVQKPNVSQDSQSSEKNSMKKGSETNVDEGSSDTKAFDDAIKGLMTLEESQGKSEQSSGNCPDDEDVPGESENRSKQCAESEKIDRSANSDQIENSDQTENSDQSEHSGQAEKSDQSAEGKVSGKTPSSPVAETPGGQAEADPEGEDKLVGKKAKETKLHKESDTLEKNESPKQTTVEKNESAKQTADKMAKEVKSHKENDILVEKLGTPKISFVGETEIPKQTKVENIEENEKKVKLESKSVVLNGTDSSGNVKKENDVKCGNRFIVTDATLNIGLHDIKNTKNETNLTSVCKIEIKNEGKEDKKDVKIESESSPCKIKTSAPNTDHSPIKDASLEKELQVKLERIDEIFNRKKLDMERDFTEYLGDVKGNLAKQGKDLKDAVDGLYVNKEEFKKMSESYKVTSSQSGKIVSSKAEKNKVVEVPVEKKTPKTVQKIVVDGDVIEINELSSDGEMDSDSDEADSKTDNKHSGKNTINSQEQNNSVTTSKTQMSDRIVKSFQLVPPKDGKGVIKAEVATVYSPPVIDLTKPQTLQVIRVGPQGQILQASPVNINNTLPNQTLNSLGLPSNLVMPGQPVSILKYMKPGGSIASTVMITSKPTQAPSVMSGTTASVGINQPPQISLLAQPFNTIPKQSLNIVQGNLTSSPNVISLLKENFNFNIHKKTDRGKVLPQKLCMKTQTVGKTTTGSRTKESTLPTTSINPVIKSMLSNKLTSSKAAMQTSTTTSASSLLASGPRTTTVAKPNTATKTSSLASGPRTTTITKPDTATKTSLLTSGPRTTSAARPDAATTKNDLKYNVQPPKQNLSVVQGKDGRYYNKDNGQPFSVPQNGKRVIMGPDRNFYDAKTGYRVNVSVDTANSNLRPGMSFFLVPTNPQEEIETQNPKGNKKRAYNKGGNPNPNQQGRYRYKGDLSKAFVSNVSPQKSRRSRRGRKTIVIDEDTDSDGSFEFEEGGPDRGESSSDSEYDYDTISRRIRAAMKTGPKRPTKMPSYIEISDSAEEEEEIDVVGTDKGGKPDVIEIPGEEKKIKVKKEEEKFELGEYPCTICETMDLPATILTCEDCDATYHMGCLTPPVLLRPRLDWYCPLCKHHMLIEALKEQYQKVRQKMNSINRKQNRISDKITTKMFGIDKDNIMEVSRSGRARKEVNYDETKFDKMVKKAVKQINRSENKSEEKKSSKTSAKSSVQDSDSATEVEDEGTDSRDDNKNGSTESGQKTPTTAEHKSLQNLRKRSLRNTESPESGDAGPTKSKLKKCSEDRSDSGDEESPTKSVTKGKKDKSTKGKLKKCSEDNKSDSSIVSDGELSRKSVTKRKKHKSTKSRIKKCSEDNNSDNTIVSDDDSAVKGRKARSSKSKQKKCSEDNDSDNQNELPSKSVAKGKKSRSTKIILKECSEDKSDSDDESSSKSVSKGKKSGPTKSKLKKCSEVRSDSDSELDSKSVLKGKKSATKSKLRKCSEERSDSDYELSSKSEAKGKKFESTKSNLEKCSEDKSDSDDDSATRTITKRKKHSKKKRKSNGSRSGKKEKSSSEAKGDTLKEDKPMDGDSDYSMSDGERNSSDSNGESGDTEDYGDGIEKKKKKPDDDIYYTSSGRKTNSLSKIKDAF